MGAMVIRTAQRACEQNRPLHASPNILIAIPARQGGKELFSLCVRLSAEQLPAPTGHGDERSAQLGRAAERLLEEDAAAVVAAGDVEPFGVDPGHRPAAAVRPG